VLPRWASLPRTNLLLRKNHPVKADRKQSIRDIRQGPTERGTYIPGAGVMRVDSSARIGLRYKLLNAIV
jgi:hypothetical protein